MKPYKLLSALLLSLLLFPLVSPAADTWEMDKAHSNIYFSIDHTFSKVNGHFNDFTSEIVFDPADATNSSFSFTIVVDSIDTNISKRDKHLLSADFFDAGKYPTMTFVSSAVTPGDAGLYNVAGKLRIKDKSYDLVLPLVLAGVKDHPAAPGKEVAGFNGRIMLDRLTYGVGTGKFYEMGVVGKDVEVLVSLELTRSK